MILTLMLSTVMMAGSLVYAGADGVYHDFTYGQLFLTYVVIVLLLKAFDILSFDWFLLCHSNFYPHFLPACKDCVGPHLFGFNRKSRVTQFILFLVAAAVLAGVCMLF